MSTAVLPPGWRLSGFGDEIDPNAEVQLAVLQALGAQHIEVRSAWGINAIEWSQENLASYQEILERHEMQVSSVASPIGKSGIDEPDAYEDERLDAALRLAEALEARYIRIFSFYRQPDASADSVRERVVARLQRLARRAEAAGVVLLHENEKQTYGDVPQRVHDLAVSVDSASFRLAWDAGNFVQCGVRPFTEGDELLRPYVAYVHVKDARLADGKVVPAGHGDGEVLQTLQALRTDGFEGFLSLEPHLARPHGGDAPGPMAFGIAARAFHEVMRQMEMNDE